MVSTTELLIVLLIIVFLGGATQLPKLAKGAGDSLKIFRKALKENEEEETSKSDESSGTSDGANS